MQTRLQELEKNFHDHNRSRLDALEKRRKFIETRDRQLQNQQATFDKVRDNYFNLKKNYIEKLVPISGSNIETLKEQLKAQIENEVRTSVQREAQHIELEAQVHLEKDARRILHLALNRFARPYCAERGIGSVNFNSKEHMAKVLGPNRSHLQDLEKACGVDISVNEENMYASVLGFDPVRRELGRLSLEKLQQEQNIHPNSINRIVENCKRELFRKISQDGQRVVRELRLGNFHEEIVNMMGALRYRYSFAQNQHFHCAEVGWLCGLLSVELGLNIKDGRRAGMLHDIGKAMDHSKDGGHAVIGADFIEKHGESAHIVHAVRAHHFDEQPSTDLAYLVIAADAISGARPGARRSTIDSYTQKMADLEKIASSFDGVIGTYILSAGREVRVVVDSHKVDDHNALNLSKDIAKKIEEECSYPGLIKVTVVRETQAVEFAR